MAALFLLNAAKKVNVEVSAASVRQAEGGACVSCASSTPKAYAAARTTSGCSLKFVVRELPAIGFDVSTPELWRKLKHHLQNYQ
jgi:hypothetical protein